MREADYLGAIVNKFVEWLCEKINKKYPYILQTVKDFLITREICPSSSICLEIHDRLQYIPYGPTFYAYENYDWKFLCRR